MSKKRLILSKDQKDTLGGLLVSIIFLGIGIFFAICFSPKNMLIRFIWAMFVVFGGFFGFIGILVSILVFVLLIQEKHRAEKNYQKSLIDIQDLPSKFVKVGLKKDIGWLSEFISPEDIQCSAKLDENGKVIYKIELSSSGSTEDYVLFLDHFDIKH